MKKIINNRIYDTDKAVHIASYSNRLTFSDFNHVKIEIFITEKGQWMMDIHAGPKTEYAQHFGNLTTGFVGIELIDKQKMFEWFLAHKDQHISLSDNDEIIELYDVLEKYFPEYISTIEEG